MFIQIDSTCCYWFNCNLMGYDPTQFLFFFFINLGWTHWVFIQQMMVSSSRRVLHYETKKVKNRLGLVLAFFGSVHPLTGTWEQADFSGPRHLRSLWLCFDSSWPHRLQTASSPRRRKNRWCQVMLHYCRKKKAKLSCCLLVKTVEQQALAESESVMWVVFIRLSCNKSAEEREKYHRWSSSW